MARAFVLTDVHSPEAARGAIDEPKVIVHNIAARQAYTLMGEGPSTHSALLIAGNAMSMPHSPQPGVCQMLVLHVL